MADEAMSPLRQRMIEDMTMRKLAPKTQQHYIQIIKNLAVFLGRSPDTASFEDIRRFQLHVAASGVGVGVINRTASALRFFFRVPKLDVASNNPAYVTVRLAPELTRDVTPPMTLPPVSPVPDTFLSSNFRLNIAGLDCTKVSKIDSFTVNQHLVGETRTNATEANLLEFPNLRIELAAVSAESWRAWFRSFVIDGNSSAANEKTGTLSFLSPNLAAMLATISFHNLGIFRLENAPADTSGEVMRVVAELYCERMELAIGSPAHASSNWGRN
jgi:hypothetical protein